MQIAEKYFTITTTEGDLDLVSSPNNVSLTYSPLFMGYILTIRVGYFMYYWRRRDAEDMSFIKRDISVIIPTEELFSYPYITTQLEKVVTENANKVYTKERNLEILINGDDNLKLDLVRINESRIVNKLGIREYSDKLSTTQMVYERVCGRENLDRIKRIYMEKLNLAELPYITSENLSRYYGEAR